MRVFRLVALAAVLLIAYFAQYLFDQGTLAHLYPDWALQRFPALIVTTLWLPEDLHTLALWLLGGSALLFGLLAPVWPHLQEAPPPPGSLPTSRKSPLLVVLLAGVALMVAWGWTGLPVRIDPVVARFGLQAQALLAGEGRWLAPGVTGAPQAASLPLGLLAVLLGSAPAAAHLLGLAAALATVAATYLLAAELFAASPRRRELALLAAGFGSCTLALLHFGRLAAYLPATALGALAAFLLLAGEKRAHRGFLVLSGVLTAAALWCDRSGLVWAIVLLLWWPGLWRQWAGEERRLSPAQGFLIWAGCAMIAALPFLLSWLLNPSALGGYLHGGQGPFVADWFANLRTTATTFFWTPDASTVFGPAGHFVISLLAPLFVLAVGGLLWSLDRPLGWRLLTWLAAALLFSSAINPVAPYWPTLLPLLPLVGIAIVFALDRMAALWEESSRAAEQELAAEKAGDAGATASLAVGLLVAAAAITAAGYYQFAAAGGDPASYTGRALAALAPDAVAVLVASAPEQAVRLDDPVVQYAAGPRVNQALAVLVDALPAGLPTGSVLIVQGTDAAALAAVQAAYPQATLEVVRDLGANPRLYILRLP